MACSSTALGLVVVVIVAGARVGPPAWAPQPASTLAPDADAIVGLWHSPGEKRRGGRVEVTRVGDRYQGQIVSLDEPVFPPGDPGGMAGRPVVDRRNPDPALRRRPVAGLTVLTGLRYEKPGHWIDGRVYDPETGRTYKCQVTLRPDHTLHLRGYIAIPLLGRTRVWTRVTPSA